MNKKNIFLIFIITLAFFLRVYRISEYPAGLNADEAAIGYNAYSLIQTGKDEFGHPWPINFQSFNDFKPGFYFYLALPFVKILGLNELSVRLPSALLGTLTVYLLYLFVRKISGNTSFALISGFLLSVSPWSLHFSRGGWETNAATSLILFGVLLFFKSLEKSKYLFFSVIAFILSMYTYHSARVISPLLSFALLVLNWKDVFKKKNSKWILISLFIALIIMIPLALTFLGNEGSSRFSGVGIFADQGPFWRVNELRGQHSDPFSIFPKIAHNRYLEYGIQFFDNYLRHFGGKFLFISGDEILRNRIPETGQMYLIEIPFLLLGIYFLFKNRPSWWKFIFTWLIIAPIASALTFQSPHAIRALNMVIPLSILSAFGLWNIIELFKNKNILIIRLAYFLIAFLYLTNIIFYLHEYYVHYPKVYPAAWEYGFKKVVSYVKENQGNYDQITMTNKYDQPYILFAFYLKYPPSVFQKEAKLTERDQYGFSTVNRFGKYYFSSINWDKRQDLSLVKNLIIGTPEEIPESVTIKKIFFKDGKTEAFRIAEN